MRKMKGSGNYLRNQVRKNLAKATVCFALFGLLLFASSLHVLLSLRLSILEAIGFLLSLVPLSGFYFYLHKYRVYGVGWEGEKKVVKLLSSKLSDNFILLNDLYLRNGGGDIDHVVLGSTGIFVLETKNWSGDIVCNGDEWGRGGKSNFRGSPSRQIKRNVETIRRIIDSSQAFRSMGLRVEGIVVFTNNHAILHLNHPSTRIKSLRLLRKKFSNKGVNNLICWGYFEPGSSFDACKGSDAGY